MLSPAASPRHTHITHHKTHTQVASHITRHTHITRHKTHTGHITHHKTHTHHTSQDTHRSHHTSQDTHRSQDACQNVHIDMYGPSCTVVVAILQSRFAVCTGPTHFCPMASIKLRAPTINMNPRPMMVEADIQNRTMGMKASLEERERGSGIRV